MDRSLNFIALLVVMIFAGSLTMCKGARPNYVIDTTSDQTLSASLNRVVNQLPAEARAEFGFALEQIRENSMTEAFNQAFDKAARENGGTLPKGSPRRWLNAGAAAIHAEKIMRDSVNGKTAMQVIILAEQPVERNSHYRALVQKGLME